MRRLVNDELSCSPSTDVHRDAWRVAIRQEVAGSSLEEDRDAVPVELSERCRQPDRRHDRGRASHVLIPQGVSELVSVEQ